MSNAVCVFFPCNCATTIFRYKPVDHRQILLPLREAFEDLFSQTYSRKQNLTFLGHVQTCFREKRWQDLLRLMDHVCKSALAKELQEKPEGRVQEQVASEKTCVNHWHPDIFLLGQIPLCCSSGRLWHPSWARPSSRSEPVRQPWCLLLWR